jgi:UDP-glucose 4-epimerase
MKNISVLVTGGAGFIGANLVRMMLECGYKVTVLDNFSTGRYAYLEGLPVDIVEGDVLDRDLLVKVIQSHHSIVHLAAQTGVPGSLIDPYKDCEANVVGTLNVLEACRAAKENSYTKVSQKMIFASSNAPLGRQIPPASEDKAPLPVSPYGASKLAAEAYCLAYYGSWGLNTIVLRFGNVYGPFSEHKGSVVSEFFKAICNNDVITIHGDGEQTRDFVYVADLCRAVLLALDCDMSGEVYQIATGVETSMNRLVEIVQDVSGSDIRICSAPTRHGDVRKNYSMITKAREILGWEPEVNLKSGLRETYEWFVHYA